MRLRSGAFVAGAALFALSACTSSGGGASSGALEVRAVIMPAQHVTTVQPDAFAAVHVPADEDAYSRLTSAQQTQLVNALRGVDCAHPPALPKPDVRAVTQTSAKPPCGESVKTPCADFLAYISDDVVVSVPVTFDPFRTAVLLSGDFTKASATRLAHKMTG